MICFYTKNETNFTHNGLGILDDNIINPVVTEELNGIFKLEFDYPTHAAHGDGLTPERIVRCPIPDMPDQLFRISEREAAIGGIFHVVAFHVFYDLAQNLIEDSNIVSKNGAQALAQLLGATQFTHGFTSSSNISDVNSARMVRLNAAAAILDSGTDNSFLSRWGGEIIRDNFFISMQTVRGSDNGVCIRDKKNLTGYRADVDYSSVCTRIMPIGFDGLMLPEKYIDSPCIGDYQSPRIRVIKYDKVKAITGNEEGEPPADAVPLPEAYDMLRSLAVREFSVNKVDLPTCSYSITFAPLERTEEYKDFAALETVNIGDTVRVVHEEDGLDISARMIGYKYDPLVKAYISIDLGTAAPKFTNTVSEMRSVAVAAVQSVVESGNFVLPQAGNDRTVNYYGSAEPPNPRVGDLWYKENGDKLELWIYETREGVTHWYPLLTDLTMEEMKQELAAAREEVEAAKSRAEEAIAAGEAAEIAGQEALAAGQSAQSAANQAVIDSQNAVEKADQAFNDAVSALNNANNAAAVAGDAYNKSVKSAAVSYTVSSSGVTAPSSGWQTSVPAATAGQYLWTRTLITLQDNSTVTSYSVAKHGDTGTKGDKGDKGDSGANAPTITAVREQHYLSTSQTTQSGGSWSDTVPIWSNGKYYWTRIAASYSNGTTTYSMPVLDNALNHSLVTALEVKTLSQTLQTTVSQHATSISSIASNVTTLSGRLTAAESSIVQTANTLMASVSETQNMIGIPFKVSGWERGSISTSTGAESASSSYLRSTGYITVTAGERYIAQLLDGTSATMTYFYYTNTSFLSYTSTSSAITIPANCTRMRIRVTTTIAPDVYTGNVFKAATRQDYTKATSVYSAMLLQKDLINLRVAKNDVINQINISTEGILIAGNKVRITGQTTIDNAVIGTAMIANLAVTTAKIADLSVSTGKIANAAITNAKIANLDAGKINTGTLSAARIAAGSITSDKLTIANGFITNAMIANATIQSAKIAAIDAAKITTGTLSAARIGANSITADKVSANFLEALTGTSSIRITGTTISYYSSGALTSQINANGLELTRGGTKIGRIGTNNISGQTSWRGLVFDLEYAGNYMTWAWKESSTASAYTVRLIYYRSKLQNGMEKGFHFSDTVFFKGGLSAASGSSTVSNTVAFSTFGSVNYLCRHSTNFKAGVGIGSSNLLLGSQGSWVDFNTIRSICAQLAGKTVYLPAGVNSSDGTLSSWWMVTFPTLTTWNT